MKACSLCEKKTQHVRIISNQKKFKRMKGFYFEQGIVVIHLCYQCYEIVKGRLISK